MGVAFADGVLAFVVQCLVGLVLGIAVDKANRALDQRWPALYSKPLPALALKLVPVALVALLAEAAAPSLAREWRVAVPGLFFVTQTSMAEELGALGW